ncbi:restriction endonuclease [Crocinitomix catalasitica]|uniref:restriction endonuclease n=1 Tax=Crocinitomix catalasitica TaxID=184607 RepID=UPI00056D4610|nr:restriction endonuclease [Crocinitomix catalasitica]
MKKTLRKPENWQDFESLCKKLWGEIWECSEIKKNGRSGQKQHGVDVYGIPKEEEQYFGIQCKGKDDYTNASISKKEIDAEIEKAEKFQPELKKFYFATSANKDSSIEEYVRLKDIESRRIGLFEIHLFCWEDIVDLIEENKKTYDWYVKNIDFKTHYSVSVRFQDDSDKLVFLPKLYKNNITYKLKQREEVSFGLHQYSPEDNRRIGLEIAAEPQPIRYFINDCTFNKSASVFSLVFTNTGNTAIKNFKVYFQFIGENFTIDTVTKQDSFLDMYKYTYNTFINEGKNGAVFEPQQEILVQKDTVRTDDFCIRPNIDGVQDVEIKWQLVSEDFDDSGSLLVQLQPEIIEKSSTVGYEFPLENEIRFDNYHE